MSNTLKVTILTAMGLLVGLLMLDLIPMGMSYVSAQDNANNCAQSGASAVKREGRPTSQTAKRAYDKAQERCQNDFGAEIVEDASFRHNADRTVTLTYVRATDPFLIGRLPVFDDYTTMTVTATQGPIEL